jgi:hypothetical protein
VKKKRVEVDEDQEDDLAFYNKLFSDRSRDLVVEIPVARDLIEAQMTVKTR